MLVTRHTDPIRKTWTSSQLGAHYTNPATPRMSTFEESLSTQPDWREQYPSYLNSNEISAAFESPAVSPDDISPTTTDRPSLQHRHTTANYAIQAQAQPVVERATSAPSDTPKVEVAQQSPKISESKPASSEEQPKSIEEEMKKESKDSDLDDDDADLDDDMLDADDAGSGKTAAERRADRRKMKRFRLTHQQTRFLMSEFAKQAHPDAAHRERLSREIPGLSPRQVQVWFQNRRAKIKRLNVDDRERMMKMRAVPDDFDNVQALHSPYGAVHTINTPLQSPMEQYSPYQRGMQPLMVETMHQRPNEDHISPTGMSPAYHQVGYAPHGAMQSPDILSPLSINSGDRYYGALNSPMGSAPHSANPFRPNNGENYPPTQRPHARPLQPLQLREAMSRSRSESVASPLRSSMSWKGDSLDYGNNYGVPSPALSGRQQSLYHPDQAGSNAVNGQQYDGNAYSNTDVHGASPTQMSYPAAHQQAPSPARLSRLRTSSAAFPPGLDLRAQQCRPVPSHHPASARGIPPTPRSGSFSGSFSAGFQSAPLTAPVDFQIPRSGPLDNAHREYNMPQMSAPMAPPADFSYAQGTLSPERTPQQATFQQAAMGEHQLQQHSPHHAQAQVSQSQ